VTARKKSARKKSGRKRRTAKAKRPPSGSGRKQARKKRVAKKKAAKKKAVRKKAARKKAPGKKTPRKKAPKKKVPKKRAVKTKAAGTRAAKKSAKRTPASASGLSVFFFGGGEADGDKDMKVLLGGKGANLAEMVRIGIPVPPGFTISTGVCARFNELGGRLPGEVRRAIERAVTRVEGGIGTGFGDPHDPLLLSVRSGARASMPGMMDTVLNLGLNDETVSGLAKQADSRFAYDSYRRLIQMYADVVLGVPLKRFEHRLRDVKEARNVDLDTELSADALRGLVGDYLEIVEEHTGRPFPQDPYEQLWGAVGAVFGSWENERAKKYRRLNHIPDDWGTAVNVQAMVYGNMGDGCATGVAFTRDPATGENHFYGEYLKNAQGEDVVAGIRTPQPINEASRRMGTMDLCTLESEMPEAYARLVDIYKKLERNYQDMQDIEFTIQRGTLWMLQTRTGKRTAQAAVNIAVDMVKEGLIDKREAVRRVDAGSLDQLLHPTLDPKAERKILARGLPASPGAAVGNVVFSAEEAEVRAKAGEKVLLVRLETSPEDIGGMNAAEGILTARGGMTSHAAVVARGMGKCCVSGCAALEVDYDAVARAKPSPSTAAAARSCWGGSRRGRPSWAAASASS
jgi:pyruvate,orthophosphate dikinase